MSAKGRSRDDDRRAENLSPFKTSAQTPTNRRHCDHPRCRCGDLTAPVAYGQEQEAQIKRRCEANGGIYSTGFNVNGDRVSQCCIKMNGGARLYCQYYVNGNWDGSNMFDQPPGETPSSPPGPPPGAVPPNDNPPVAVNPPDGNPAPTTTPTVSGPPVFVP